MYSVAKIRQRPSPGACWLPPATSRNIFEGLDQFFQSNAVPGTPMFQHSSASAYFARSASLSRSLATIGWILFIHIFTNTVRRFLIRHHFRPSNRLWMLSACTKPISSVALACLDDKISSSLHRRPTGSQNRSRALCLHYGRHGYRVFAQSAPAAYGAPALVLFRRSETTAALLAPVKSLPAFVAIALPATECHKSGK